MLFSLSRLFLSGWKKHRVFIISYVVYHISSYYLVHGSIYIAIKDELEYPSCSTWINSCIYVTRDGFALYIICCNSHFSVMINWYTWCLYKHWTQLYWINLHAIMHSARIWWNCIILTYWVRLWNHILIYYIQYQAPIWCRKIHLIVVISCFSEAIFCLLFR